MKEMNIHVTKTGWNTLDGTWIVVFTTDKTKIKGKEVTFCAIRKDQGIYFAPTAGCSVKNPLDADDPLRGEREAFKRAVEVLCGFDTVAVARFRGALWIAMGRPNDKRLKLVANPIQEYLRG